MQPRAEPPAMAGYGVGGDDWNPLPWSWAATRLDHERSYWLCTATPDGRPHSLPVWGVWNDDEARLVVSCAPTARKARNLRSNSQAVVTTESTVECLSIEGRCDELQQGDRFEEWITRYIDKYGSETELSRDFFRSNLMFEFVPERAFAVIERPDEFATRATRWTFDR